MSTPTSLLLREHAAALAEAAVDRQYATQPEIWPSYGSPGRAKSVRDAGYHLDYLIEALNAADPSLFTAYLAWVKVLFAGLRFPESVLPSTLACTRQALIEQLPADACAPALEILEAGILSLAGAPATLPSYLTGDAPLDQLARRFSEALLAGDRMVADFFEMDGWDTYFLGANTPAESVLRTADERRADVLAVSCTMTFHIPLQPPEADI